MKKVIGPLLAAAARRIVAVSRAGEPRSYPFPTCAAHRVDTARRRSRQTPQSAPRPSDRNVARSPAGG